MNNILLQQESASVSDERDYGAFIPSALDDYGLDVYEFRLYCRIARRAGTGQCWESLQNMADGCRISVRQVRDKLTSLLALGMIRRQKRPGKSDLYILTNQKHWTPPRHPMPTTPAPHAYHPGTPCLPPRHPMPTKVLPLNIPLKGIQQQQQEPDVVVEDCFAFCEYQEVAVDSLASLGGVTNKELAREVSNRSLASLPSQEEPTRENSDLEDDKGSSGSIASQPSSDKTADTEELKAAYSELDSLGIFVSSLVRSQILQNLPALPGAIANLKQRLDAGQRLKNPTGAFIHALKNQLGAEKPKDSFAEWFSLARELAVVSRYQEREDGVLEVCDMAGYWCSYEKFSSRWTLDYLKKRSQR